MNHQLRANLEAAAKGHAVTYGDAAPNLFADALAEIKRLDAIETDVKTLFSFQDPEKNKAYASYERVTHEEIAKRLQVGRRLGESVGALLKASPVKAVA